ncbi:hypothetical protein FSP39_012877 [Pinctada imbricata]|uniref:Reverse transcriptase domain-containing protein n=1 Tax=Pinctada imbricata TaxID=66713 RepID=A0AA89BKH0_PINIB|nr:hypothetical protein FSP39_012877 [Pinctada imbricata]
MPLTVEPTKPRLCHDERYLNLWIQDSPFQLDTLKDAHRLISENVKMFTCDEKSGYDHVKLSDNSYKYFGIQFAGWVFVCTTLPFGWKASAYVYQTIGSCLTSYFRRQGFPCIQYIDDRLHVCPRLDSEETLIEVIRILTSAGYTLNLNKCQLAPSKRVRYLGFIVDSEKQAYIVPDDKKVAFINLRESILSSSSVTLHTLQRFAGKCISLNLAVPAAKLYTREVNLAISKCQKNSRCVPLSDDLRSEIEH